MNDLVDISPDHLKVVQEILRENLPSGVAVWVFGSRASWATSDSSDLDLALEGDIDHDTILALEMAFEESSLPYTVDVIDLNQVSDKFKRIVDTQKIQFPMERYSNDTIGSRNRVVGSDNNLVIEMEHDLNLVDDEKTYIHNEWQLVNLGDCIIINDESYSPKEAWPFINYLDTRNIYENHINKIQKIEIGNDTLPSRARRKVKLGDIVYSMVRPNQKHFGIIKKIPENFLVSTGFAVLRGINNITNTDFVYWFLTQDHIIKYLHSLAEDNATAYPAIKPSDLETMKLLLPSLPEQCTIASILRALDDKINLNRRMNQTLEGMARALFKSWFVDFDPVRAKMDGRWRSGESLPGLPAHLYDLFPNELVDSELGEIPKGWEVSVIGNIARILGGTTPSTKVSAYWKDGVHYWATPKDLSTLDSPVLLNTTRKITDAGLKQISSGLLPSGIVLLSSRAPIGYMAITEIPVAINQGFIAILPHLDISNIFVYHWCQYFLNEIKNYANGSTFLEINKNNFRKIPIIVPDIYIMNTFHKLTLVLHNRIVENECSSCNLSEQRNILLPKLVSGLLRVSQSDCNKSGLK